MFPVRSAIFAHVPKDHGLHVHGSAPPFRDVMQLPQGGGACKSLAENKLKGEMEEFPVSFRSHIIPVMRSSSNHHESPTVHYLTAMY